MSKSIPAIEIAVRRICSQYADAVWINVREEIALPAICKVTVIGESCEIRTLPPGHVQDEVRAKSRLKHHRDVRDFQINVWLLNFPCGHAAFICSAAGPGRSRTAFAALLATRRSIVIVKCLRVSFSEHQCCLV